MTDIIIPAYFKRLTNSECLRYIGFLPPVDRHFYARATDWQHVQVWICTDDFRPFADYWPLGDRTIEGMSGAFGTLKEAATAAMNDRQDRMIRSGQWPETRTSGKNLNEVQHGT